MKNVILVNNKVIYGKSYGTWPYAYYCANCSSYVGIHKGTDIPLGTLADAETRNARKESKTPFEIIWKNKHMSRTEAYQWLADNLNISVNECHFGWFEKNMCIKASIVCEEYLRNKLNDCYKK